MLKTLLSIRNTLDTLSSPFSHPPGEPTPNPLRYAPTTLPPRTHHRGQETLWSVPFSRSVRSRLLL
ncbi:hypothetical protein BCR35DRAFT_215014 [Leucosporidium creatinivorum]|uniref:Uncharacterized protein n=1 Tax=Leucosporidium creatinivorum TaxID=106004 RepID=A0A1Y2DAA5_9BASI|nr:hypothetical protein BCR35DRAFT_215014 [Leucosporidium creatinivorum]